MCIEVIILLIDVLENRQDEKKDINFSDKTWNIFQQSKNDRIHINSGMS